MPNTHENAGENALALVNETLSSLKNDNERLSEALAQVTQMFAVEDKDWTLLAGGVNDDVEGLSLEQVHEVSDKIREGFADPIVKRGAELRVSYVWSKGIALPTPPAAGDEKKDKRGRKTALENALNNRVNIDNIFSESAHAALERSAYSDGNVIALCDDSKKQIRLIPIKQIKAFITHPDFPDEVWGYRREWTRVNAITGKADPKKEWYLTDRYSGAPMEKIRDVDVSKTSIIIDQGFNKMTGWPLGIPDALPAIAWAKLYSEFLKHGYVMSKALAQFAFKASVQTKQGAANAAMKLAKPGGSGQTAILGGPNDLTAMPSAGKGYDFSSGRAIAAQVATSVSVSLIHLLSDPGAAGSSYGSASNLDLPTKRAMVSRQKEWVDFYRRIFVWLGVDDPQISFPALDDPDFYREVQGVLLAWSSGLMHDDEIRRELLRLLEIVTTHAKAPDGVLLPNNRESLPRKDIDVDSKGEPTGASPDQGQSTDVGKGMGANDLRSDGIGEALRSLNLENMLRTVLERLDTIAASQSVS